MHLISFISSFSSAEEKNRDKNGGESKTPVVGEDKNGKKSVTFLGKT